jgi:nifR3 family TIM-barrel protein
VGVTALRIGPIEVDPPVVLAPMAGVTNLAFRRLCRGYGAGLYVSEMVTARALLEGNVRSLRMASFGDDEPVRSLQLYGTDPRVMRDAVRRLVDEIGVDHLDLNFGCPAAKVTKKGGGGVLPVHRVLFRDVVRAAVGAAGSVPVTVKTRLGVDDDHVTYLEAGRIAEDEGAGAIALHARTVEQLYSGAARPHRRAALQRRRRLARHRGAEGGGHVRPRARQRRHLGGGGRVADDRRDRLRRRRRRPRMPRSSVALPRSGRRLRRPTAAGAAMSA